MHDGEADVLERGAARHTIPAIDRMMDVLGLLERSAAGCSISEIARALDLPRTSVYRILNSLESHAMVRRSTEGNYSLGRRIMTLAAHVAGKVTAADIAAAARPHLNRLAAETGYSIKLSILDVEGVFVVAVAQGRRDYALTVTPGQKLPVHAGAAAKLLLAHLPDNEREAWLARPLTAYTRHTVTESARLRGELQKIRRLGWSLDRGESTLGICAFAAPVRDRQGQVMAALSIPFVSETTAQEMERLRLVVIRGAEEITSGIIP